MQFLGELRSYGSLKGGWRIREDRTVQLDALERVSGKLRQIQGDGKVVIRILGRRKIRAFQEKHGGAKVKGSSIKENV